MTPKSRSQLLSGLLLLMVLGAAVVFAWYVKMASFTERTATAEFSLRRIVYAMKSPLLGPKEFPPASFRASSGSFSTSWRLSMIQDFEPGPAIPFSLTDGWSEPVNSEVARIHHPDFCVGTEADDMPATVYVILNGASLLEVGNDWRKNREIPCDAIVAVYLPVPLVPNWTAPGDICMNRDIACAGGTQFDRIPIDDAMKSVCIFWDLETWEFTGRTELRNALRFADLEFADAHDRGSLLRGKGRVIRPARVR